MTFLRLTLYLTLVLLLLLFLFVSPVFRIRYIEVSGNHRLSFEDIQTLSDINTGQNILSFGSRASVNALAAHPYIASAHISRHFPDTVAIEIVERLPIASIQLNNSSTYLLIDDMGFVLSVSAWPLLGLPVIEGVKVGSFSIGSQLEIDLNRAMGSFISLSRILRRYDISADSIDITNELDIIINVDDKIIYFGNMDNADRRAQSLAGILGQLPRYGRGFIFIRETDTFPRFVPIR